MALSSKQVTKMVPQMNGTDYNVPANLKCWEEGKTPGMDDPDVDVDVYVIVKGHVDGKTTNDLVDEWTAEITEKMQAIIDEYNKKQLLYNKAKLDTAIAAVETALTLS